MYARAMSYCPQHFLFLILILCCCAQYSLASRAVVWSGQYEAQHAADGLVQPHAVDDAQRLRVHHPGAIWFNYIICIESIIVIILLFIFYRWISYLYVLICLIMSLLLKL